jgi:hypothetical protein
MHQVNSNMKMGTEPVHEGLEAFYTSTRLSVPEELLPTTF